MKNEVSYFNTSTGIRKRAKTAKEGRETGELHTDQSCGFQNVQCPSEKDPSSGANGSGPQWKRQAALAGIKFDSHLCIKSILAVGCVPATVP